MATTLKLVWKYTDDANLDTDTLDLLNYTEGFNLKSWVPQVAAGDENVIETITLRASASSNNALATKIQDLEQFKRRVELSKNSAEMKCVFLRTQWNSESQTRDAYVANLDYKLNAPYDLNAMRGSYINELVLSIERGAFWEPQASSSAAFSSLCMLGGKQTLSGSICGDAPARLETFRIGPNSGSTNYTSSIWAGFKTNQLCSASNFVPNWKLNNSAYGTDTTAVSDSTAQTGYSVATTFATNATLIKRTTVLTSNVSANVNDQRGTFLVLMRAKMSDTSVARARITYSFSGLYAVYRPRAVISGTAWQLYEMGTVTNPPSRVLQTHNIGPFTIDVYAERLSGTGELHLDCLILIPIDDGAIKATVPTPMNGAVGQKIDVIQAPDNSLHGLFENGADVYYSAALSPQNAWRLPNSTTAPIVVIAATDSTYGSWKGSLADISFYYRPRWRTLRGNAT